ncbi:MAG: chloride channel protein [Porcipelethomonas sp.]
MGTKLYLIRIFRSLKRWTLKSLPSFFKWIILGIVTGAAVGVIASAFHVSLEYAAEIREEFPYIILLLPVAGLLVAAVYRILKLTDDKGTNMVLLAVRNGEDMTWRNTLGIFTGSVLTHVGGGSAGREGAALQIGGSIGSQIGLWLKLGSQDHRLITMCGMSAGFSALFGTPVAAAFFSMEVISVGIMHYSAIVPCVTAALVGFRISSFAGVRPAQMLIQVSDYSIYFYVKAALLAAVCAFLSIFFCFVLKNSGRLYSMVFKNPYLRIAAGGVIVAALTFVCGTREYNGAGMEYVKKAFETPSDIWEFALKLLFTALTLGAGFKGGEILPAFFVGSAFGSAVSPFFGMDCSMGAAIGLACLFCGITNCPVASVFLCAELFGTQYLPVYLLVCGISYMLSGYGGLYSEQRILYSKLEPKYIGKK